MAFPFNNYPQYYPQGYQQYYPQQTQGQIQNGGIIPVSSIDVARNYHVAPGTSVTFIDENAPYVYTKTRGFSQLEPPVFEKLRLVKEEDAPEKSQNERKAVSAGEPIKSIDYATKADISDLRALQEEQQKEIDSLKEIIGDLNE